MVVLAACGDCGVVEDVLDAEEMLKRWRDDVVQWTKVVRNGGERERVEDGRKWTWF